MKGETRTPAFLAKSANGRVPALELEDGTVLAESDAILFYLAEGTPLLPDSRLGRAQALQWMFFEQYSHEPFIAVGALHPPSAAAGPPARGRAAAAPGARQRGARR